MSESEAGKGAEEKAPAEAAAAATAVYTLQQVAEHKADHWVVINDQVYNVAKFLDEHPGGEEILLEQTGTDASENFEDVGHSADAREMMKDYRIGELAEEDKSHPKSAPKSWSSPEAASEGSSWMSYAIPMTLAFVASILYRIYLKD